MLLVKMQQYSEITLKSWPFSAHGREVANKVTRSCFPLLFLSAAPQIKNPYISLIHKDFSVFCSLFIKALRAENESLTSAFLIYCSSSVSLCFAGLFSQSGTPAGTFFANHFLCGFYPLGNCFSRFTDANIVLFSVMRYQVLQTFIGALDHVRFEQFFDLADLVIILSTHTGVSDLSVRP